MSDLHSIRSGKIFRFLRTPRPADVVMRWWRFDNDSAFRTKPNNERSHVMNEDERECVEFGNKSSALPGAISGAAIAVGVPAVTLILGKSLASGVQLTIILVGVGVGGLIALTATFF